MARIHLFSLRMPRPFRLLCVGAVGCVAVQETKTNAAPMEVVSSILMEPASNDLDASSELKERQVGMRENFHHVTREMVKNHKHGPRRQAGEQAVAPTAPQSLATVVKDSSLRTSTNASTSHQRAPVVARSWISMLFQPMASHADGSVPDGLPPQASILLLIFFLFFGLYWDDAERISLKADRKAKIGRTIEEVRTIGAADIKGTMPSVKPGTGEAPDEACSAASEDEGETNAEESCKAAAANLEPAPVAHTTAATPESAAPEATKEGQKAAVEQTEAQPEAPMSPQQPEQAGPEPDAETVVGEYWNKHSNADNSAVEVILRLRADGSFWHAAHHSADDSSGAASSWDMAEALGTWACVRIPSAEGSVGVLLTCDNCRWASSNAKETSLRPSEEKEDQIFAAMEGGQIFACFAERCCDESGQRRLELYEGRVQKCNSDAKQETQNAYGAALESGLDVTSSPLIQAVMPHLGFANCYWRNELR